MDIQTLHAETFGEISQIIERDTDLLVQLWIAQATEEQPSASPAYRAEITDKMPAFLRSLASSLRRSDSEERGPHRLTALEHGEQRWSVGWRLSEVVRDYQILRIVLVNHLSESLGRPLTAREAGALGLLLDEAIGAAVVMFVAHHEHKLGSNELQIREIMNSVADAILVAGRDGEIRVVNPAAERMFGYAADDLLGAISGR